MIFFKFRREIRECLKLDPEHKDCFPFYKKIKKIAKFLENAESSKDSNDYKACIEYANKVINAEKTEEPVQFLAYSLLCKCYMSDSDASKAVQSCQEALKIDRTDVNVFCDSAEAHILAENYDEGM